MKAKIFRDIIILILVATILVIGINYFGFLNIFGSNTKIEIRKTELDKGRFVKGDKISITDRIRIKQSGVFVKEYEWMPFKNIRKEIELEFLTETGYFIDDIIKSEVVDSLVNDNIIGRSLIVEVPYPDSLFFEPAGDKALHKEGVTEGWVNTLAKGFFNDEEAIADFIVFIEELKQNSYESFLSEHANPDSNSSLARASMSILNFVNNGYSIGKEKGFSSVKVIFRETKDLGRFSTEVTCFDNGSCTQKVLVGENKIKG